MINNLEFGKRLKIILDYYQLSATTFAEKINVQRSSISHLVSGRNKPSLDFVLKVLKTFNEIKMDWLLFGKGDFPNIKSDTPTLFDETLSESKIVRNNMQKTTIDSDIDRIVIFYKNGSFKEYIN